MARMRKTTTELSIYYQPYIFDRNEQACAVLRAHPYRRRGPEHQFRASCFRRSGADQYPVLFSILGMTSVVLFGIGHKYILGGGDELPLREFVGLRLEK